jgi:two-component system nitrogen regulation sensor histidine kinase GlnL
MQAPKIKAMREDFSYLALKMLQVLPDAVAAFDSTWRIVFMNDAGRALFQAAPDADLRELLGLTNVITDAVEMVMRSGASMTLYDISIKNKHAHAVAIRPMEAGLYLLAVNLYSAPFKTEWSDKARHALKPAQLMARTLAHEIKNPLAGIQAAAQLLGKLDLKEEDRGLTDLITKEAGRILRLVGKADVFDDVSSTRFKFVNLHEVLRHVMHASRTAFGPGVRIEESYDPSLPDTYGDFDSLVQVVMNLVKNAAESTAGRIRIGTFYDNAAVYHPDSFEKLPLCVEIEDDGPGIGEGMIQRIFDPYFTTKSCGAGLGLCIVSKIMDDHGGRIDVNSVPGKTVFKLSFPLGGKKA